MSKHLCPVCRLFEFSEKGSYEICEVCGWEDDPVQEADPDFAGGANFMSLNEARREFAQDFVEMGLGDEFDPGLYDPDTLDDPERNIDTDLLPDITEDEE